ncbi:uncharacterized protein LOC112904716 [Agrilus planipennis]|uniref:Uncharacterized protein LOC112904716 n=1 Tax=Agrilus planipennis TaxID=224129 RepID=A0A7F5R5B8_AGRPL|nr:uncharacterized protein LOC112904716 [Agrilus planipennis]
METLKVLTSQRAQIKSRLTRFKNSLDNLTNKEIATEDEQVEIQDRLADITLSLKEYEQVHFKIVSMSDDVAHDRDMEKFERTFYEVTARAKCLISKFNTPLKNNDSLYDDFGANMLKLPSISLPTFSGRFENWVEFHDSFDSLINKNPKLSDIHKFYYLLSAVKGDAAQSLKTIKISSENYNIAWDLLKRRFENKKLIVQNSIKALFNIESMKRDTHQGLQTMLDDILKLMQCLQNYKQPTLDSLLIYIISAKFSLTTRQEWENFKPKDEFPTFSELIDFLEKRCSLLGSLEVNKNNQSLFNSSNKANYNNSNSKSYVTTSTTYCHFCKNSDHSIYTCQSFLKLSINERISEIKRLRLCLNCLRKNHFIKDCLSKKCKKCNKKHNTILHLEENNRNSNNVESNQSAHIEQDSLPGPSHASNHLSFKTTLSFSNGVISEPQTNQTILSTACVNVEDSHGKLQKCRVLLDVGSQSNFITNSTCLRLGLKRTKCSLTVGGIGETTSNIQHKVNLKFRSCVGNYSSEITCFVLDNITDQLPLAPFNIKELRIPENIRLADSKCNVPSKIDILIGAGLFWNLLCVGQYKLGANKPTLQKTQLGWVLGGEITHMNIQNNSRCHFLTHCSTVNSSNQLDNQLTRFWELDEFKCRASNYSPEEQHCEEHFINTHTRDRDGRFVVSIPYKREPNELGESKTLALKRFYSIERKLERNDSLKNEYVKFMEEYESLGHMTKVADSEVNGPTFYLPHHAVIKQSSITTKVRVVFDGSAKSDSGISLNDIQCTGPTIQNDIHTILLRFRQHAFVVTADIAKMYRQVLVNQSQRNLQLILWRKDKYQPVNIYRLNTVTYGTACASFLSTRCLKQLAIENRETYKNASQVIENDFYVDDLLTGCESIEQASELVQDVSKILSAAGFELRQWNSNSKQIISNISVSREQYIQNTIKLKDHSENKTLGILWNPERDSFQYDINNYNFSDQVTKRSILSATAQIFDPLGLLAPIVIIAKLIIQDLWQSKLSWDESIPLHLNTRWLRFKDQLPDIREISIPRWVTVTNANSIELHGFSDASEKAYGACIYVRSKDSLGNYSVSLLCAKSRVAPLKNISLPRLELCGAVVLAQLMQRVKDSINLHIDKCIYWCDSTITLSWLSKSPSNWKTFVANRVAEIQRISDKQSWFHVGSKDNPADLISRGVEPKLLQSHKLWWNGPRWLSLGKIHWPSPQYEESNVPDQRLLTHISVEQNNIELFSKFSELNKLMRVVSYCFRFISNVSKNKQDRILGQLTNNELQGALLTLIRLAQQKIYFREIHALTNNSNIGNKSNLLSLNPILDKDGILRVGGRIQHSNFSFDKKHPIILPSNHKLTNMIVKNEHVRLLHCGVNQLLASLRDKYWPISGKNVIKKVIRNCITCFRANPRSITPLMGSLPRPRVIPSPPFSNCGVDYAGPVNIKEKRGRGSKTFKAYICIFVCFATKGIHLELVTSLTAEACMAAIRRFISRRGLPQHIYSDNGTNFVGTKSDIQQLYQLIRNQSDILVNTCSKLGISWHFIPPRSPHFGGLWEAGVKAVKYHLKRVAGNALLTYEEYYTLLTQIEAVLNSRPLSPISNDPNDLNPLTPSHFLIGRKLSSIPEPSLLETKENRLTKYEHIQKIRQHFWKRWSKEYISELQVRTKWKNDKKIHLNVGTMVLLKEENAPPLKWQLGRIVAVHPGTDGIIRVVSVKTGSGTIVKRVVSKVCALPLEL